MLDSTAPEQWRPIPSCPGYEASDLGRVRSVDRVIETRRGPQRWRGKVLAETRCPRGYALARPQVLGYGPTRRVHDLVAEAWLGPRPAGSNVLHGPIGNVSNAVENLRYGTQAENMADRVRDGNSPQASKVVCDRGHSLVEPNLRPRRKWRQCLACHRAYDAARHLRSTGVEVTDVMFKAIADERYAAIVG